MWQVTPISLVDEIFLVYCMAFGLYAFARDPIPHARALVACGAVLAAIAIIAHLFAGAASGVGAANAFGIDLLVILGFSIAMCGWAIGELRRGTAKFLNAWIALVFYGFSALAAVLAIRGNRVVAGLALALAVGSFIVLTAVDLRMRRPNNR